MFGEMGDTGGSAIMESSWLSPVDLSLLSSTVSSVVGFSVVTDVTTASKKIKSQLCSMHLSFILLFLCVGVVCGMCVGVWGVWVCVCVLVWLWVMCSEGISIMELHSKTYQTADWATNWLRKVAFLQMTTNLEFMLINICCSRHSYLNFAYSFDF